MNNFPKEILLIFCLFISSFGQAKSPVLYDGGIIKGHVMDKKTGEPLTGAVISISNGKTKVVSGLDGSFSFRNLPAGDYQLTVTMISYESITKDVKVIGGDNGGEISLSLEAIVKSLDNVVVSGRSSTGTSDASARQIEKVSDNVLNILSARTIQLAPDVTVANVLRRVSGVTVDRGDDGEGRYPVIRGMDKRYNYTLVNGIKIPSPDDKNRYVPMDIFPSEMLQRLEVIKALTPDMEGDAVGGVMNLVMKEAPEHLTIQAQAALGYSQTLFSNSFSKYDHSVNSKSPLEMNGVSYSPTYNDFTKTNQVFSSNKSLPNGQLGFTIGNRFLKNKLGIIFSASLQGTDRISKEIFFSLVPNLIPLLMVAYLNTRMRS